MIWLLVLGGLLPFALLLYAVWPRVRRGDCSLCYGVERAVLRQLPPCPQCGRAPRAP